MKGALENKYPHSEIEVIYCAFAIVERIQPMSISSQPFNSNQQWKWPIS